MTGSCVRVIGRCGLRILLVKKERAMPVKQGDLGLLQHPASKELLESKIPARLAYIWTDGTPRVIPIWFHWNGRELVMATPPKAPKLRALARNPKVSLRIDDSRFPHKVLFDSRLSTPAIGRGNRARVHRRGRGLLRTRTRRGMDRAAPQNDSQHGENHDHAGVGRIAGLSNAFSECAVGLR